MKTLKKLLTFSVGLGSGAVLILGLPSLVAWLYAAPRTFNLQDSPSTPIAIVFGAGLSRDGSPSPVLRDRVATAAQLYFEGKVSKLLMSGDNRFINYNEPGAMRDYALQLGVPEADIVLDYAGRRTYDTCYRARYIFGVRQALLVTQAFHLPRALFTCNMLGIEAWGVMADRRTYHPISYRYWRLREIPATLMAFVDVWLRRSVPVLGEPEPIFPDQRGANLP